MALARKCDICGKFYERYNERPDPKNTNAIMFVNITANGNYCDNSTADCCPECMSFIRAHIESLKKKGGG